MNRTKVFISYSHQDAKWLERLQVHLKPLEREGVIDRWDDTRIKAGEKWRDEIENTLTEAKVAVLLVSADFLASDFIADNELPPLLAAAEADGAVIIPVILSPSLFEQTDLAQFQAANSPHRPLIGMDREDQEQVFVKAAKTIQGLFKGTAQTGARQETRWEGSPMGSVPRIKQSLLHWYASKKTWVFSVIGTAVLMALIGYLLSQGPEPSGGVHVGGDLNINGADGGPAIIQTGEGTVHITTTRGFSKEEFQSLSEELGVTKAALKSFFKILEQKQVPPEDLDSALREIARRYKAIDKKLATFTSDDPAVKALKEKAKGALEQGDFDRAERLLNKASEEDVAAAKEMQIIVNQRWLSAAEAKAENGEIKYTQLAFAEAAKYYSQAVELVPEGEELTRANYLSQKGLLLREAGLYEKAQSPLKQALAICEKVLGSEHPDVAKSLNNLALLYYSEGRYAEAEQLYRRALDIREKALDPEHSDMAKILDDLAELYRVQGKYTEAEPLVHRALKIRDKVKGPQHPDVAESLNTLAMLYYFEDRYAEAEQLYRRALDIREKALDPKHPDIAKTLSNLATLYRAQCRYDKAEPLYERALDIFKEALGAEHPYVATSLNNLAVIYLDQGRYKEAEQQLNQAMAIRKKVLESDHPHMAHILNNMAAVYRVQGRHSEAESHYKEALAILGPDYPNVSAVLMKNYTNLLRPTELVIQKRCP